MPLKHGVSADVVHGNIQEMIRAGHEPKQAVAAALSMKRKSKKKMAMGGTVPDYDSDASSDFDTEANRSMSEDQALGQFMPDEVASPETEKYERMIAKKLFEQSEREHFSGGGIVQPEHGMPLGNKPDLDWIDDGTSEPMSEESKAEMGAGLSEEAMAAIRAKKMKRRYA